MAAKGQLGVLIVEDEALVARDLAFSLVEMGHDVIATVDSCVDAVQAARDRTPDIVLMDIRIKGDTDGVETADRLIREFKVPVVFITAYTDQETLDRAARTRPYGYIVKPFTDRDVRSAIEVARYKHEADTVVAERERWFSTTLRSIGDAVIACSADQRIEFMNRVAEHLTGWSERDAKGKPLGQIMRLAETDGEPIVERSVRRAIEQRVPQTLPPSWLVDRGGECNRMIDDSVAPILYEDELLGVVIVFRDVTEKQRMAEQIAVTDRLIVLGTVAASVGHEINTPLAYNLANIAFAERELHECRAAIASPELQDRLRQILDALHDAHSGAERISSIAAELRPFSLRQQVDHEIDVRACLEWAIKLTTNQVRHAARFNKHVGPTPPVIGNEVRLSQVFVNLLVNAAEAVVGSAEANEIVVVLGTAPDGWALVEVHDTGTGVSAQTAGRIFEPFFSTKPSTTGSGSGLGLSICRAIVEGMQGRISLGPSHLGGACFRVLLPPAGISVAVGQTDKARASAVPRQGHVLVIDDEPLVARSLKRLLERNHTVTVAEQASDALAWLKRAIPCDVVLCDMLMPGTSGIEVYEQVRVLRPELATKIVFMTGGEPEPKVADFLARIGNLTITKPFTAGEIEAIVQQMLALRDEVH